MNGSAENDIMPKMLRTLTHGGHSHEVSRWLSFVRSYQIVRRDYVYDRYLSSLKTLEHS